MRFFSLEKFKLSFKFKYKTAKLPLFLSLLRWKSIDIYRFLKTPRNKRKLHFYGIRAFVGSVGGGKTMAMVDYLERMRNKYGDRIIIATNFYYLREDFHLDNWHPIIDDYDRPVLFCLDEIQNVFNSRNFRSFPPELSELLTQNRKGHGKQILWTAQVYTHVDKSFRDLTGLITTCKTFFGRYTRTATFDRLTFESMIDTSNLKNKSRHKPKKKHSFVQSDSLRGCYDSFQFLKSVKSKEYLSLDERSNN